LKVKISDHLLVACAAVIAFLAALSSVLLPANPITFVFAVLLFFFLPGYALTRAIFHDALKFDLFLLLSIGLSVVSAMIIALVLAIMGVLTVDSSLVCLVGVTIIALLIDRIDHSENRTFEIEIVPPTKGDFDPVIAVAIAFGLILIGIFGFIILTTHPPSTTHVFIKDPTDLPKNLTIGNAINITVQVYNGEGGAAQFGVAVNETNVTGIGSLSYISSMTNNETKDFSFSFIPTTVGYQQFRIEVTIDGKYYGEVHFWVNVV
jgi:uncharacterized membrane protein